MRVLIELDHRCRLIMQNFLTLYTETMNTIVGFIGYGVPPRLGNRCGISPSVPRTQTHRGDLQRSAKMRCSSMELQGTSGIVTGGAVPIANNQICAQHVLEMGYALRTHDRADTDPKLSYEFGVDQVL